MKDRAERIAAVEAQGLSIEQAGSLIQGIYEEEDARTEWGRWKYVPDYRQYASVDHDVDTGPDCERGPCLILDGEYPIELSRLASNEAVGHWLLHMEEKDWVTLDDLGQLVRAIGALQRSGRMDGTLD